MPYLTILLAAAAWAVPADLAQTLRNFERAPVKFMREIPAKSHAHSLFSAREIQDRSFVAAKNQQRPLDGRAAIGENDRAENLVDLGAKLVRNFQALQKEELLTAEVKTHPWSDSYWPLNNGGLAFRYADKKFPKEDSDWKEKFAYMNKALSLLVYTNSLSPAEKYDLLVGDKNHTFTRWSLAGPQGYYLSQGKVESWMGICDGWSPASYNLGRPARAVEVLAADGVTMITFYPSDIKALASMLWDRNPAPVNMIGGRCNVKEPKTNAIGRVIDPDCFDTNPGTWHLAVVNQIGLAKRSFVMDATFDYQVWNQPLVSYAIEYFNPQTMSPVDDAAAARVPLATFASDRFREFRSPRAATVVGVNMKLVYTSETDPSAQATDNESDDATETVSYLYDLELDAAGDIIGGEWYFNAHPDFLWTPRPGARALSPGDQHLIAAGLDAAPWRAHGPMPAGWRDTASRTSASGSPLALVVENLIRFARARK